jgi:hypothetical protein
MAKYHCTVDLLFDWFGLVCFSNKNQNGTARFFAFSLTIEGTTEKGVAIYNVT